MPNALLKFNCIFCGTATSFEDGGKAYCIDCYVKIRDSAHTHLPVNPWPVSPLPTRQLDPMPWREDWPPMPRIIC